MVIRIVSYNIHKGFSAPNRRFVLPAMKQGIKSTNADIIFLQEVLGAHTRHSKDIPGWPQEEQLEFLADQIWPHHAYGKNASYKAGHHGNAILSKFPISSWSNTKISTNRFEHRGILHTVVTLPGSEVSLHCLCTHFGLTTYGRRVQLERLCHEIEQRVPADAPLIVAGDFNDWRGVASPLLRLRLELVEVFQQQTGKHAASFPALLPLLSLDRIYCRHLRIINVKVLKESPWNKLSDHAALYAELDV